MTTIAWTPGQMAADSCITNYDADSQTHRTIKTKLVTYFSLDEKWGVAIASRGDVEPGARLDDMMLSDFKKVLRNPGAPADWDGITAWLNTPARIKKRIEVIDDCSDYEQMIAFMVAGLVEDLVYLVGVSGYAERQRAPYVAIGSDSAVALGALCVGGHAIDAVQAACKHGVYTAGPVDYMMRDKRSVYRAIS